jgi:GNAT superfamily N-acetyltransferase
MTFQIREITFEAARPYASRAAREHVSIANTRDTRWYGGFDEAGTLVGVAGLLKLRSAVRIKGVWVAPSHRARGLGRAFVDHLIAIGDDECSPAIEAYVWNPVFYEGLGFIQIGNLPNGAVRMKKTL